jgi:hypothetical protein
MKRTLLTSLAAIFLFVAGARSAGATEVGYGRKFGLGFVLGDPTGLSAKYWVSSTNALDFGLGFTNYGYGFGGSCFVDSNGNQHCSGYYDTSINVDYLWQSNIVRGNAQLDWYIGGGGRVFFLGSRNYRYGIDVAARAPVGLALMFNNPSFIEVFFELAPALYLLPPAFTIEGGLGVRFYF